MSPRPEVSPRVIEVERPGQSKFWMALDDEDDVRACAQLKELADVMPSDATWRVLVRSDA